MKAFDFVCRTSHFTSCAELNFYINFRMIVDFHDDMNGFFQYDETFSSFQVRAMLIKDVCSL